MNNLEKHISLAEVAYKTGAIRQSIRHAKNAQKHCADQPGKTVALDVFIARAYSKIGKWAESNQIYRRLLRANVYMPPVIMGLFYNNFQTSSTEKMRLNLHLIKTICK